MSTTPVLSYASDACPTFFRALCHEASTSAGSATYSAAGFELTRHLATLSPTACTPARWSYRLGVLSGRIGARSGGDVLAWFDRNLPRCMELVPQGSRAAFLRGVFSMVEHDPAVLTL